MTKTLKILSALLSYPDDMLASASAELAQALDEECLLPGDVRPPLDALIEELGCADIYELQERYVELFDRTRSLSLHLFEHVHGQGRDRGQAMVDLMGVYERHGLTIQARELPDHLPLFLEFLSILPAGEAREFLSQIQHIVVAIKDRLRKRRSVYAAVFAALEELASGQPRQDDLDALRDQPDDDPRDLAALDQAWQDEAVTFGPGSAGMVAPGGACPAARATLARMDSGGKHEGSDDG